MPTTTKRRRKARPGRAAPSRDRALVGPFARAALPHALPGLPPEVALNEDPLILAGVIAVWLDSEEGDRDAR